VFLLILLRFGSFFHPFSPFFMFFTPYFVANPQTNKPTTPQTDTHSNMATSATGCHISFHISFHTSFHIAGIKGLSKAVGGTSRRRSTSINDTWPMACGTTRLSPFRPLCSCLLFHAAPNKQTHNPTVRQTQKHGPAECALAL
jgi:hypothetical protein